MQSRGLDNDVEVVSFSKARERFKAALDRVEADADVTLIITRVGTPRGRW